MKAGRGRTNENEEVFEEVSGEPTKRQIRGKGKGVQVSKGRRTRAKVETEEEEENKIADKLQKEKEEKEVRGTMERLERERIEQEEMAARFQKERDEKERVRLEKEQETKRLEKERVERENKELASKQQKEKEAEERVEKERQATELMEKEEKRQKEEKERLERENMAQEEKEKAEKDRLEVARKQKEKLQKQDKAEQLDKGKQNEEGPRRGRRTGRRTIAVPDSTAVDEDDVPARRTRSRSNSSNSVNSEISVSSNVSQTSRGRGRGRGGRKTEVQVQKTVSRGRRRTAAAPEVYAPSPPRTLSRSNSSISLSSELSVSSISSTSRNRGGRAGKKADIERAKEQASSQTVMPRGRKSTRICPDTNKDKGDNVEPPVSTRGKRGAKENSTKCNESQGEDPSTSRAEKRGGRTNQAQTKKELDGRRLETNDNEKDTKNAAARNTPTRKSMKVTQEETKSTKPKGRGRASVLAKTPDERSDSGSSGNNSMDLEQPQTPRSSVSRKRSSADSESDVFPKTPRSCTASPSTGRSRTPTQPYRVLFTGMVDEDGERVLTRLGGTIAKDVVVMNCLVTDKVRRTVKFLCAVAKGIPIVTSQWLEKSGKAGTLLLPSSYLVKDREQENKFDFNLQESLRVASNQPFLKGYEIHVTKSVKPEPVHMKDIISCSGAVFLPKMPSSYKPNTVVVSCEEDWSLCAPAVSCGLPIVTSEFILTGILQQKLDLDSHKLSGPVPAPTTAAVRGRGRKKP
uniref:BRCT domain-containing protein n=1 Tax=Knipowitschia caucasica TaxID=637954 RepID=A0AAV2MBW5_KNICA